jgi:hypothetical protein
MYNIISMGAVINSPFLAAVSKLGTIHAIRSNNLEGGGLGRYS